MFLKYRWFLLPLFGCVLVLPHAHPARISNHKTVTLLNNAEEVPFPVRSHPRLWVTTNDLVKLKSWAVPDNPVYGKGMVPLVRQAYTAYRTRFFPGGVPNRNYPDPGDVNGYNSSQATCTEQVASVLAFNSLIDPTDSWRIRYAQAARNMLMYAMDQAALGHLANTPFRDPAFAISNRSNYFGEGWPLIVDWIYSSVDSQGNPILTAADKMTIRKVFLMWARDCLRASTTGGDHPEPVGVTNSLRLLPNHAAYRMASNNYYLGHARLITMMSLCIDPADDPPLNNSVSAAALGNTLRSYIPNATGAWLYQEFAMMGDPSAVAAAYGMSGKSSGFGLASGGLSPEGMLYGHSYQYVLGQLLALQTAGFNSRSASGPQIGLINAPLWGRYIQGLLSSLTPAAKIWPSVRYLGPLYQFASYGDLLRLWATPEYMQPPALLALLEQENGSTAHTDAARWFAVNGVEGGENAMLTHITNPWAWSSTQAILYYLLMDPTKAAASDPRQNYPRTFYDAPAGRLIAHSDWTPNATMFDYRASWNSIYHQSGDGGQFELYRNGEWLTKEMSNYDTTFDGVTTMYHNTLALQNWCPAGKPVLGWFETKEWPNGSQWILGLNAGDPVTVSSNGPGYVYVASDLTNLYNRPNKWTPNQSAVNISQATRSILWLNNDYIVVYDRARSINSGLFKRFNLSLETDPTITGNVAAETLPSGQKLFVQTLLPESASITAVNAGARLTAISQLEPMRYILTVENKTLPANTRFLNVLQGADSGTAMARAEYAQNSSGTPFDGAVFSGTAIFFPVNTGDGITSTTLPVRPGVHIIYITGLSSNEPYTISRNSGDRVTSVTINHGSGVKADPAGVLKLTL